MTVLDYKGVPILHSYVSSPTFGPDLYQFSDRDGVLVGAPTLEQLHSKIDDFVDDPDKFEVEEENYLYGIPENEFEAVE